MNNSTSVPQIPARRTSTTTCPAPATGTSTSCTRADSGPVITSARIGQGSHLPADEVLANLPRVAAASAQVEHNLTALVQRARALGATWARIREALGMTRQSAWERFSGEE